MEVVGDRLKNDAGYDVNSDKISALGWAPRVGFKEGLRRTVDWYLQNPIHWGSVDKALEAQNGGDEADSSDMSLPSAGDPRKVARFAGEIAWNPAVRRHPQAFPDADGIAVEQCAKQELV